MECYRIPRSAYIATAIVFAVLLALFIGSVLMPPLFWDSLIWPYLWGPVVADAYGTSVEGIVEGYNLLNTVVYGLVMSIALYWCYVILRKLEIETDWKFILALSPYIVLGGTMRALEDAYLFKPPVSYFFIAPIIYLTLAAFVFSGLFCTWLFVKRMPTPMVDGDRGAVFLIGNLVVVGILVMLFVGTMATQESFNIAVIFVVGLMSYVVSRLPVLRDKKEGTSYLAVTASNGTFLLLMSTSYIMLWLSNPWKEGINTYPWELVIIPAISAAISAVLIMGLWFGSFKFRSLHMFILPTSVIIIMGHLVDATATYRGIAKYGYVEKHVIPKALIELAGTPLVMFAFKIAVVLFVIYLIEGQIKEEIEDATMMGLLRLAVLVLGISPGIRDLLRIAMGV